MSKKDEALKLALEALEIERNVPRLGPVPTKTSKAITALREALADQPAQQEPVAWTWDTKSQHDGFLDAHFQFSKPESSSRIMNLRPLCECHQPAQPAREPLSDDARGHLVIEHLGPNALLQKPMSIYDAFHMGIDAAEAAHGITKGTK